jgi:hypothetical protein
MLATLFLAISTALPFPSRLQARAVRNKNVLLAVGEAVEPALLLQVPDIGGKNLGNRHPVFHPRVDTTEEVLHGGAPLPPPRQHPPGLVDLDAALLCAAPHIGVLPFVNPAVIAAAHRPPAAEVDLDVHDAVALHLLHLVHILGFVEDEVTGLHLLLADDTPLAVQHLKHHPLVADV